ncbi:hypothetical protein RW1_066_00020 [Rhodococcus wratislaviensis NBRC 100605]|uniref:Uncharacterized protein n=1 Tax=Rhodococcus wratislaviensis NBRC 100605 TaxID=1219028 RepID=X0QBT5_RHOWR|nr:hypothetical protein RW1_066_00020 [Rhodococcus wratislaviensis NBRC 100605]
MPAPHQVPPGVLTGADEITGRFLFHRGHAHFDDLTQPQESSQMQGVTGIGLDPVSGRAL